MSASFTPAARTERRYFANQVEDICKSPIMSALLNSTGGLLIVLNEDRRIAGFNDTFMESYGISDPSSVLGLRLGDTLNCVHAQESPDGCGTRSHCVTCGFAMAVTSAIDDDQVSEKTCFLAAEKNGSTLELHLSVKVQPLTIDGVRWILIFAQDITQQQYVSTLEHIFFHDISNILTALVSNSHQLAKELPDQRRPLQILNAVKRLCAEVKLQRYLNVRSDGTRLVKKRMVAISDINKEVELISYGHPKSHNRSLEQVWPNEEIVMLTDIHLTSRVLGNMLLNAMEATPEEGTVRLHTTVSDTDIMWEVWNDAYIPPEVQSGIFQKHFSTKASTGRGMGTHSMKLLGEKHLNGKVTFSSSLEAGTTFCFKHPLHPCD